MKKRIMLCVAIVAISISALLCSCVRVDENSKNEKDSVLIESMNVYAIEFLEFKRMDAELFNDYSTKQFEQKDVFSKTLRTSDNNKNLIMVYIPDNGYCIINPETGSELEKQPMGKTPYDNVLENECYYFGVGQYAYSRDGEIIRDVQTDSIYNSTQLLSSQQGIRSLMALDIQESKAKIVPCMTDTETRVKRARFSSEQIKQYFTETIKCQSDYNGKARNCIKNFNGLNDLIVPYNTDTSCGPNAAAIILQYYDRTGSKSIPDAFYKDINLYTSTEIGDGYIRRGENSENAVIYSQNDCLFLTDHLSRQLDMLMSHGGFGENTASMISNGINAFYNKFGSDVSKRVSMAYHPGYQGIVDCIDRGKLAIMTTTTQNGYYSWNINSSNPTWEYTSAAKHNMVVYGYCYTAKGTLKDFICHSGWGSVTYSERMYVYKIGTASNITEV